MNTFQTAITSRYFSHGFDVIGEKKGDLQHLTMYGVKKKQFWVKNLILI